MPTPLTSFHRRKQSPDGLGVYCKHCACTRTRKWAKKNPARVKETAIRGYSETRQQRLDAHRLYRYGVTPERFAEMQKEQNGQCGICGDTEPGGKGTWHIDHCHETNVVRALLCHYCNTGLGKFFDEEERLLKAVAYLRFHKQSGDALNG